MPARVCVTSHGNPPLNPLILPLEAELSVNKGGECNGKKKQSGLSLLSSSIQGRSASHLYSIIHLKCDIPQKLMDLITSVAGS